MAWKRHRWRFEQMGRLRSRLNWRQRALSDFLESQISFFARGLELMSGAHQALAQISPEIDLKPLLQLRNPGAATVFWQTASCSSPIRCPFQKTRPSSDVKGWKAAWTILYRVIVQYRSFCTVPYRANP